MTEAEAKTKWCPFVRSGWTGGVESQYSGNRWFEQDGKTPSADVSCLGSRCMAWRRWKAGDEILGDCGLTSRITL